MTQSVSGGKREEEGLFFLFSDRGARADLESGSGLRGITATSVMMVDER
jgi:hypothetical protein